MPSFPHRHDAFCVELREFREGPPKRSVKDIAAIVGRNPSTVGDWISGRHLPDKSVQADARNKIKTFLWGGSDQLFLLLPQSDLNVPGAEKSGEKESGPAGGGL